jgi:hypothetical protein
MTNPATSAHFFSPNAVIARKLAEPEPAAAPTGAFGAPAAGFEPHYARHLPNMQALPAAELFPVTGDVRALVAEVLAPRVPLELLLRGVAPALAPRVRARLGDLESLAMAMAHADTLYCAARRPHDALRLLVAEGRRLRTAWGLGLSSAKSILPWRCDPGAASLTWSDDAWGVSRDLEALCLRARSAISVEQKRGFAKPSQLVELGEALEQLAGAIVRAALLVAEGAAHASQVEDLRRRAFSLFMQVYGPVRRARQARSVHRDAPTPIFGSLMGSHAQR